MVQEKDKSQKTLQWYNDVFADIINVIVFDGKRVVREEELYEADPITQYKTAGHLRSQQRDASKYWAPGRAVISLIGLENQTDIDPDMPLRVISYDGASYRDQIRKGSSGVRTRYPVITLILYFGTKKPWDHPVCLHDCLNMDPIVRNYVSDYSLNIVNVAFLAKETIAKFQSDFRQLAEFFYQVRTTGTYRPDTECPIRHPNELIDVINAFVRDKELDQEYNTTNKDGKEMREPMTNTSDPIQVFLDEIERKGEKRGEARGEARGEIKGQNLIKSLGTAMKKDGRASEFIDAIDNDSLLDKLLKEYQIAGEQ